MQLTEKDGCEEVLHTLLSSPQYTPAHANPHNLWLYSVSAPIRCRWLGNMLKNMVHTIMNSDVPNCSNEGII